MTNNAANIPTAISGTVIQGQGVGTALAASSFTMANPGTSGNLLTSDGTNWTSAAAPAGGVTSIAGTTNQIAMSSSTGAVTASLVGPYTPATYTAHGLLIGEGTSSITAMAAGSAGQIVQSGGASADPVYSTATYPSTATGTGKILRADGTNWSATTATYPNASVASGNVLYDNGTNFISSVFPTGSTPPTQGLQYAQVTLTSAQIKALHASPITLVAAAGAGTIIVPVEPFLCHFKYGGSNVFVAGSAQVVALYYGTAQNIATVITNAMLVGSTSTYNQTNISSVSSISAANIENQPIKFFNLSATEISGNAGNDNTITVGILYFIATL